MTQTATALSNDGALDIHKLTPSSTSTLSISATTTERASTSAKPPQSFRNSSSPEGSFYQGTSQLKYGDKAKFSFAVTESYRAHFILIKGLLEFHRAPEFVFSFNKQDNTFEVTSVFAGISQPLDELNKFLKKIAVWLDQELSFKRQLKEMMAFEREYRAKLAKVYSGGDGFTLIRVS
ncbi:MAG TPA: hypothetical protein VK658_12285 [Chryseolinea sp.]|nr:hypothetical protein [Chryseolinea sp.]